MINKILKMNRFFLITLGLSLMYNCGTSKKALDMSIPEPMLTDPGEKAIPTVMQTVYLTKDQIDSSVKWKLSKMNGVEAGSIFDKIPTLSFDTVESRVQGTSGCNRFSGPYQLTGGESFTVSKVVTTRMACSNKNDEPGFLSALQNTAFSKIEGNSLLFLDKDENVILEFTKE